MTASTPASRRCSTCTASFTVHTLTCTPRSWARVTKAATSTFASVHTSGCTAACPCSTRDGERGVRIEPERQEPGRELGRERVDPVDGGEVERRHQHVVGLDGPTTGPTTGRRGGRPPPRPPAGSGSLISTFTSRPRQTSSTAARVGTSGSARARSAAVSSPSRPTGVSASWRTTSTPSAVRWTSSSTPSAPRSIGLPASREPCSPAPAGWHPGARARASRSPCHPLTTDVKFLISPLRAGAGEISLGFKRLEARPGTRKYGHTA